MRFERSGDKKGVLEDLLEQSMVLVTVDARFPEVSVPDHLRHDPQLRLNLSYNFDLPIAVDDTGVRATLTFGGERYECALPWHSIYMFVSHSTGQPVIFPADVPEETLLEAQQHSERSHEDNRAAPPRLQLVEPETAEAPESSDESSESAESSETTEATEATETTSEGEPPPPPPSPPRRGHLRVVK